MAFNARVGKAVLEITADSASYDAAMDAAKKNARELGGEWKQAAVDLRQFSAQYQAAARQVSSMTADFLGDRSIANANHMVTAIRNVGGASKLTASEQARVNSTVKEAIEKYRALGQTAPKAMLDLEAATRRAQQPTSFLTTKMVALGAAVGTFASTMAIQAGRALAGFVRNSFASASAIDSLSKKTGQSIAAIQRMQFVARMTDSSLESFTDTAFRLSTRLAGGGTSVKSALEELATASGKTGLSLTSTAEDIFSALSLVQDQQTRTRLGVELMGRSYANVAAAISENYDSMAKKAKVATDAEIKELDRLDDEWNELTFNLETYAKRVAVQGASLISSLRIYAEGGIKGALAGASPLGNLLGGQLGRLTDQKAALPVPKNAPPEWFMQGVPNSTIQSFTDYTVELKKAQAIVNGLTAAQRAQIAAAQQLGATEDELVDILGRFGVKALDAEGVLKVFSVTTKETKQAADVATTWIKANHDALIRLNGAVLDSAKAGVPMNEVLKEFGDQIGDAVLKARIFHQTVPPAVMAAAAAVGQLDRELEALTPFTTGLNLPAPELDFAAWDSIFDAIDARSQQSLTRRHDGILQAREFEIDLARARGASEQQLFILTERLERSRLDVTLGAENARFEIQARGIDKTTELYRILELAHQDTVNHINEQWAVGVERRAALFQTETMKLVTSIKGQLGEIQKATIGSLATIAIGPDRGNTKEARAEVERLKNSYDRLKASGTASAEALTRAFKEWHEAVDRQNENLVSRWESVWMSIKRITTSILDEILGFFAKKFITGIIKGLGGARLGESLGGILGGLGGAAGGATAAAAAAPAAAALLPTLASSSAIVAAGSGVGATAAVGGGAAAGGGLGATVAGLATNPFTIGAAAAIGVGLLIAKKGLFRGGEEAMHVNPRRDRFTAQFGGPHGLAARLTTVTQEHGGGPLYAALARADSVKEYEAAQAGIVARLAAAGQRVKSFALGGFVPPRMTVPAVLHGGPKGEVIVPLDGNSAGKQQPVTVIVEGSRIQFTSKAIDSEDTKRWMDREVWPALNRELLMQRHGIADAVRKAVQP